MSNTHPGPYGSAAWTMHRDGWHPLPVPHGRKDSPPAGFTGYAGVDPSGPDIAEWVDARSGDNIAARLPRHVIGLDVDAYDGKPGAATLAALTYAYGDLAPTVRVSARFGEHYDGVSGIRLYRLPDTLAVKAADAGTRWRTGWNGIDLIRHGHRYVMAPPSTHPNGATYRALDESTGDLADTLPPVDTLPELPAAWCDALTSDDNTSRTLQRRDGSAHWTPGRPCRAVHAALGKALDETETGRHDGALAAITRLTRLGEQGHDGVRGAIDTYRGAWTAAVTTPGEGQRTHAQAAAEWARMVDGIDAVIDREPTPADSRGCCDTITAASQLTTWDPDTRTGAERLEDAYARDVATELHRLRVRADAAERFRADNTPPAEPFDAGLLADVLTRPDTLTWRVDGLHPAGGSLLIVAQRKTGKTTLTLNYARAILTGETFLGTLPVQPVDGTVALLNFEVSGATLARWAADVDVPADRLVLVNLRGRRNPLGDVDDRGALVDYLTGHNVSALIVDPFGRAYTGQSQNDPGEVGAWLAALDTLAADIGATETVLTTHAGWNGERTRGSSALEDWADAIATLTRDDRDDNGQRYLRAIGRDVDLEEDALTFDPATRLLTLSGAGSRTVARANAHRDDIAAAILAHITDTPGLTVAQLTERLREDGHGLQRGDVSTAARHLETSGRIERRKAGRAIAHYPQSAHNAHESRLVPTSPMGPSDESRPVPIGTGLFRDQSEQLVPDSHTPETCPHGMKGGATPDPFIGGRASCPECALAHSGGAQ